MSLWADQQIRELKARVKSLEDLIADMVSVQAKPPGNGAQPPEPMDKRTRGWKEWKEKYKNATS